MPRQQAGRPVPRRAASPGILAALLAASVPVWAAALPQNAPETRALADMEALAAKEDPTALTALAGVYQQGRGVPRDLARAAALYQRAAELGNAEAQYNLGNLYLLGEGVERDDDWAFTWYRAAAKQGHALARKNVDEFYRAAGITPPTDSGEQTEPAAGTPGTEPLAPTTVAPDSEQAQEHSAARHPQPVPETPTPDELAALDLARAKGIDIEADGAATPAGPAAATTSEPQPQVPAELGALQAALAAGKPLAALPGLESLARGGNAEAQWLLSGVLSALNRTEFDKAKSRQWLQKAADGGIREAQFALGSRFERGDGVEADDVQAISWYRAAARQGHAEALQRLEALYRASGLAMPPLEAAASTSASPGKR